MVIGSLLELRLKMSKLTDTHSVQLTNIEIFVLTYILKDFDVDLELNFKDGKKTVRKRLKVKMGVFNKTLKT